MGFPPPLQALNATKPLPITVEQLNDEWFSDILQREVRIKHFTTIHGTASKVLVTLEDQGSIEHGKPTAYCVKGGFMEIQKEFGLDSSYSREAEFFYYLAPKLDMRVPRAWFSGTDTRGQGIVVQDNLVTLGCSFGQCARAWSVEQVSKGLGELADLHGKTWWAKETDYTFLQPGGDQDLQKVIDLIAQEDRWKERLSNSPVPDTLRDRKRVLAAIKTLWATRRSDHQCILHGDPHVGNTFFTPTGQPGFLDFQNVMVGSPFHDVAYFIGGALHPDDRRVHERELLDGYLDKVHKAGAARRLQVDEVWDEYRKYHLHGVGWAVTAPFMQGQENIDAMATRHSAAALDHHVLELMEAMPEYKKVS